MTTTAPEVVVVGNIGIDTNGAGDSLAVGFLTSYVPEGRPLDESALRGQILARHTCTLRATSDGLASRAQLEAYRGGLV